MVVQKNAVVVSLKKDISEIVDLAQSLGYNIVETFYQKRDSPDVNSYIGSGKAQEVKEYISNKKSIKLVIVDGRLKPSQWFTLEKITSREVYDRVRLILAIFEERADRREARLQVKLAQLQYEKPFVKELIHRARSGEHPGYMAGGGYQVDDYYEKIKKQMKKIKQDLKIIRTEREVRRKHRHRSGFYLVSLAGYTNAGKSSLLNLLSEGDVKVEGKLFSTLSTVTRKISDELVPILLTDTVGFIQDLPALIIDAFHSTLEEISMSDMVLLIVDVSAEKNVIGKKLRVSLDELSELGVSCPIIIVLNKIDLISESDLISKIGYLERNSLLNGKNVVPISVETKENISDLFDIIYNNLPRLTRLQLKLPVTDEVESFISWIYDKTNVENISYDKYVSLSLRCKYDLRDKIISRCEKLGGSVVS